MTVTRRVLRRPLAESEGYDAGEISPPHLQAGMLGHGLAVDLGQECQDLVNRVEGELGTVRFAGTSVELRAAA